MSLSEEIEKAARQISTDAFSLTIGEMASMYSVGDIIVDPNFQRLFRWDVERKSRLIESILVRIPLPSIFVFELGNSKWEVIDGLQRLSTILEFMGELKNSDGDSIHPRSLVGTQYLPSLKGAFWSKDLMETQLATDTQKINAGTPDYVDRRADYYHFDGDTQRAIKRTKIGIQLLEKKSDPKSKYDLFQRLNSGGIAANDQELRNCAMVMVSPSFFSDLKRFAESEIFMKLIPIGTASIQKSNHLDNLCKIIAFSFREYRLGTDIEEFVTNAMVEIAQNADKESDAIFGKLQDGLNILVNSCGYNALRPFKDDVFVGRIGRTAIEIILVGILKCLPNIVSKDDPLEFVRTQIVTFWQSEDSKKFSAAGIAGTDRVQFTIPLGIAIFSQ